jgi:chromosome segregation ATPase
MPRLSPPLLAFAIALALSATPVAAQQITTSHGVRTLTRPDPKASEMQLRQNERSAEEVVVELLKDIDAIDRTHGSAISDIDTLSDKVKKENADWERAKAAFQVIDQRYRDDLAAFQLRSAQLDADTQRQRTEAATLQALPSAQRDYAQVSRLNDWAAKLNTERQAVEADRTRLLADHDYVEGERAKLAKQRTDAETKLKGIRDSSVGRLGGADQQLAAAYNQLRVALAYLRGVRDQLSRVASTKLARSEVFEQANAKLLSYDARARSVQK